MTDRASCIRRVILLSIGCLVCQSIDPSVNAYAAPAGMDKLSPALRQTFAHERSANYLVLFADKADLRGAPAIADKNARRQFVYDRLRAQALRTQAAARAILQGKHMTFREHYLLNALEVQSDLATATDLAALAGVTRLDLNRPLPDYPALDTTVGSPTYGRIIDLAGFQAATLARQQLANDIFLRLKMVVTGQTSCWCGM